jgi:hypothetical protein
MTASINQSDHRRSAGEWAMLIFGLIGSPLAWASHSTSIVLLVPASCDAGGSWPIWISTVISVAVSLASILVAWRVWQASSAGQSEQAVEDAETASTTDQARGGFLSWGGLFLGVMFLGLILIETIPLPFLAVCTPHP